MATAVCNVLALIPLRATHACALSLYNPKVLYRFEHEMERRPVTLQVLNTCTPIQIQSPSPAVEVRNVASVKYANDAL